MSQTRAVYAPRHLHSQVLSISPKATLLVILCVPILSLASIVAQGSSRRKAEAAFQSQRLTAHMASEVIANARTVQSFCAEEKEGDRSARPLHPSARILMGRQYGHRSQSCHPGPHLAHLGTCARAWCHRTARHRDHRACLQVDTLEHPRYTEGLKQHQKLEKEYRVFTSFAHLFFGAVNLGLSAGGLYFGSSLVKQGFTTPELMMEFMQYSWKIGGAIGSLMSVVNEQQKAVLSATRVFNTIRRTVRPSSPRPSRRAP